MEEAPGRSDNPVGFLRRGSGISLRNQTNEERPSQYNNKPGKTTNLNSVRARWAENREKPRYLHEPFPSPSSKASFASSSKAPVRKYYEEKQKRPFLAGADNAESSNRRTEVRRLPSSKKTAFYEDGHSYTQQTGSDGSSSVTTVEGVLPEGPDTEVLDTSFSSGISARRIDSRVRNTMLSTKLRSQKDKEESSSSSAITVEGFLPEEPDTEVLDTSFSSGISAQRIDSTVRNTMLSTKPCSQKDKEESSSGRSQGACTFDRRPIAPQSSTIGVTASNSTGTGVQRRGLKNLGCALISDVLPSGCSSSDYIYRRRVDVTKKRTSGGENSSRSRAVSRQASLGHPPGTTATGPRARAAEQSASQQTARISSTSTEESIDSVRTRRSSTQRARERMPREREGGAFALRETVTRVRHSERGTFSMDGVPPQRLARPFYAELPHAVYSSNRQGSVSRTTRRRSSSHPEGSPAQMLHGLFGEGDGYGRINMEGITEVLLALDRVEQEDELTYEQLLVLETNLFLSGFGLHDQHHDMRLDIDNMSYEELLALEEQIGSVSTALSEEQFTKYVNRSVYKARNSERELKKIIVDDVKCSICQEEYIEGEEVGRMQCEHQYHVCCIHEWLTQKNWCPICKASAIPSVKDKGGA